MKFLIKIKWCLYLLILYSTNYFAQKDTNQINLVTWNLFSRSRFLFRGEDQITRAKEVVNAIKSDTMDIIVFQEAWDKKARTIIKKGLSKSHPFVCGPYKKTPVKFGSAVMILSKYPIKYHEVYYYKDCEGSDCTASKAVLYANIQITKEKNIHLFGTHLQSMEGELYRKIRASQIDDMKKIADKHRLQNTVDVFMGDFNVKDTDELFPKLLSTFNSEKNIINSELKYSSSSMNTYPQGETVESLIDHVFIRKNDAKVKLENYQVVRKTFFKENKLYDLSDHFLVKGKLSFFSH